VLKKRKKQRNIIKCEVVRDSDKKLTVNCEAQKQTKGEPNMIAPGIRVVRGPDWIWQNQGENIF
jgi:hypothetical protein